MSDLTTAPFNKLLGIKFLSQTPERSEAELHVREDLLNRRGVMHGGAIMALADTLGAVTARIIGSGTSSVAIASSTPVIRLNRRKYP